MGMDRRKMLKLTGGAAAALFTSSVTDSKELQASPRDEDVGVMIDITRCDGCPDVGTPRCVSGCKIEKTDSYPKPKEEDIQNYWPRSKHEDWRSRKNLTNTLTPFNWTFVQKVKVEHEGKVHHLNIQRRCMHCNSPSCLAVCPFGSIEKKKNGAVKIHENTCMGGAKCRTVCPWNIPQRQAGVGVYLDLVPKLAGGGVMYKCDLCSSRLDKNQVPACVESCQSRLGDKAPLIFGPKKEVLALAQRRAREIGGYLYGDQENSGTGTFYVSPVPFEKIDKVLRAGNKGKPKKKRERFLFPIVDGLMQNPGRIAEAILFAPIAAIGGAILFGSKANNKKLTKEDSQ